MLDRADGDVVVVRCCSVETTIGCTLHLCDYCRIGPGVRITTEHIVPELMSVQPCRGRPTVELPALRVPLNLKPAARRRTIALQMHTVHEL